MNTLMLPRPGPLFGRYPQRLQPPAAPWRHGLDAAGERLFNPHWLQARQEQRFLAALDAAQAATCSFGDELTQLRALLSRRGFEDALLARAQALVARAIESQTGLRPYATQHRAARAMLGQQAVQMQTGEGKTLAILIAAAVAAMAGVPVHVITANDMLAERDAAAAQGVLRRLGLSVCAIAPAMHSAQRRVAYRCDVVYCSARELGFDYLRDRLLADGGNASPASVLRGLSLALIDEADSVLIDHAQLPLVISMPQSAAAWADAMPALWLLSAACREGIDFRLDSAHRQIDLLDNADAHWPRALLALPTPIADRRIAADLLRQALIVRHLLQRDRDYLVVGPRPRITASAPRGGEQLSSQRPGDSCSPAATGVQEIVLIDGTTGRATPGTQWSRSLQQLVSIKEGCPVPKATRPVAQISLQALFARYWRLGGISGTLQGTRLELRLFYRLGVHTIAPLTPSRRIDLGLRVVADRATQWRAVAHSARRHAECGQPVLIGTASVAESEALAAHLQACGLPAQVLNARHGADEAQRLQHAGEAGAITVTTVIAGRGTDLAISAEGLAAGGLHVIRTAPGRSERLDRQLLGRTARNGGPGSTEAIVCLALSMRLPARLPTSCAHAIVDVLRRTQSLHDLYERWQRVREDRRQQSALAYTRGAV